MLDKILVDAAAAAGAEVREGFTVEDVIVEDGTVVGIRGRDADGTSVIERARIVIGADGRNSHVAKVVEPEQYNEKPNLQWGYYTYWSGLPVEAFETYIHPDRGWALLPTNDDLTLLVLGWPYAEANAYKSDVEANYLKTLELTPSVRGAGARREARGALLRRVGAQLLPQALSAPAGDSSATPVTTRTRSPRRASATRSATRRRSPRRSTRPSPACARSTRRWPTTTATRDEHAMPIFEFTTQLATLEAPPPEVAQVLFAVSQSPAGQDDFVSMVAGTMSPIEFFDPAHIGPIMGAAAASR